MNPMNSDLLIISAILVIGFGIVIYIIRKQNPKSDDSLIEKYLGGEELSVDEIKAGIRKLTVKGSIYPVFCGSALGNIGVQKMLDGVVDYLPSPLDVENVTATKVGTDEQYTLKETVEEPFSALAFKIQTDPFVGRLTYIRVYSGVLNAGSYVLNSTKDKKERVGRILLMHANHREEIKVVKAGEIAAVIGLADTITGDTLCDEKNPIVLESISFAEPVIGLVVEPKTKSDRDKMGEVLKRFLEEDPTLKIKTDPETSETILYGMGELHLEIIVDRMKREFKVEVNTGKPQVAYRECIKNPAKNIENKYIRQSGGRGQYGHVIIDMVPMERGSGVVFEDKIVGGSIPKEYVPAVQKGIKEASESGGVAGYPVTDIKVILKDGSFHEVDSSEMAFKMSAIGAFREAQKAGQPYLLEPIMQVDVTAPEEFMGDIIGNLSGKRGKIEGTETQGQAVIVKAKVPLGEMFGYATELRGLTQGRAGFSMEPSHYEEVPANITEEIVKGKA